MHTAGIGNGFWQTAVALSLLLVSSGAVAAPSGAIFTTNADGTFVNGNVYDHAIDVYLNGGPRANAPCTAAGLPDDDYYFQVTDPSGSELLSGHGPDNGIVTVQGGIIVNYAGSHATGAGKCGSVTVRLCPYAPTPNEGDEYKVWMTPVSAYSTTGGTFGFFRSASKTDNFKVPDAVCNPGD